MTILRRIGSVAIAAVLAACAGLPDIPDRRAAGREKGPQYRFLDLARGPGNSDDTLVLLAFSGGGARAASMAFGVLEALHRTRIGWGAGERSLLSEVDLISGTSGGAFTAAFFGLYRDKMFERGEDGLTLYERRYLKRPVTRQLTGRVLRNILRINTSAVNRSDVAAEYYGDTIFGGLTYTDLLRAGRPFVVLNANDTTKQSRFTFTQAQFDQICATLAGYPVARAVTASSAVDGVFAPIKLRNFSPGAAGCPREPKWVEAALQGRPKTLDAIESPRDRLRRARLVRWYRTGEPYGAPPRKDTRYYVHLGDGGAMDNIGLWPILRALGSPVSDVGLQQLIASGRVKRVLLIVVNAMQFLDVDFDRRAAGPSVYQMLVGAVDSSLNGASRDAIRMSEVLFANFRRRYGRRVAFHGPVVVEFASLRNPRRRRCFLNIETALDIQAVQVDALRRFAARQLEADPRYKAFLNSVGGRRDGPLAIGKAESFCAERI